MKKMFAVLAALLLVAMLVPARPVAAQDAAPDCTQPDIWCVGLVTDVGKIDDKSFNQSSWEGIQQALSEGLIDWAQYIETTDSKDYDKNIATFADAGYDIIVTSGFNLGTASMLGAQTYPNVMFIAVDQSKWVFTPADTETPANYVGLIFAEDKAGFLVGALAAQMSATHKIGAVCGTDDIPPVWKFGEGYKAGAAYADSLYGTETTVYVVYHNDVGIDKTFIDPEWGAATADSMIDKGADVIFGAGGKTGNGAVEQAAARGVYAIGVDVDQYYALPDAAAQMLSSAFKDIKPGVYALIVATLEGSFPGGGDYEGPVGYAPFHDLEAEVPAEVVTNMETVNAGIQDGSILTNVPPTKPAAETGGLSATTIIIIVAVVVVLVVIVILVSRKKK